MYCMYASRTDFEILLALQIIHSFVLNENGQVQFSGRTWPLIFAVEDKGKVSLFILDNPISYISCCPWRSSKDHPSWVLCYYRRKLEYPEKTCEVW